MTNNDYSKMQKDYYEAEAARWRLEQRDPVVGSFDLHNAWTDYDEFLFKNIGPTQNLIALDFGCGPGRNLVKFVDRFQRIDGVDISQTNLDNAKLWLKANNINIDNVNLFMASGADLAIIATDEAYDVVFSTIALQHICVYSIRYQLMKDFYRLLKHDGWLCAQMGFGPFKLSNGRGRAYHDDFYEAEGTNGKCDVCITDPSQLDTDLTQIGFVDFSYDLRPTGPGDEHDQWIFFRARKP